MTTLLFNFTHNKIIPNTEKNYNKLKICANNFSFQIENINI